MCLTWKSTCSTINFKWSSLKRKKIIQMKVSSLLFKRCMGNFVIPKSWGGQMDVNLIPPSLQVATYWHLNSHFIYPRQTVVQRGRRRDGSNMLCVGSMQSIASIA